MPVTASTAPTTLTPVATAPVPRTRAHPVEVQTRIELVKIAYRELGGGMVAAIVAAIGFAVALTVYESAKAVVLGSWITFMIAVGGYGLWLARTFRAAQ